MTQYCGSRVISSSSPPFWTVLAVKTETNTGRNPGGIEMKNVKFRIGGFRCVTRADTSISHGPAVISQTQPFLTQQYLPM